MRPDELERRLRERLDALDPAPRAELLHVLMLPDFERADRIGSYYGSRRAPAVRKPDTWSAAPRLSRLTRQRDCDGIVTRHHWPFPTQGHIVDVDRKGARMRRRVLLIGGLSLVVVGVFGAGYTVRDLARGITEAPSHWWSTAPWMGIVLGVGLLVLARILEEERDSS
jgi:hypothetical protein